MGFGIPSSVPFWVRTCLLAVLFKLTFPYSHVADGMCSSIPACTCLGCPSPPPPCARWVYDGPILGVLGDRRRPFQVALFPRRLPPRRGHGSRMREHCRHAREGCPRVTQTHEYRPRCQEPIVDDGQCGPSRRALGACHLHRVARAGRVDRCQLSLQPPHGCGVSAPSMRQCIAYACYRLGRALMCHLSWPALP